MSKAAKIGIGLGVIALIALAVPWNRQPDNIQIRQAVDDAIVAGKEGRPGTVLDFLTSRFEVNGEQIINRTELAKMIRLMRPDVSFQEQSLKIEKDSAVMMADFTIKSDSPQFQLNTQVRGAKMEFSRERYQRWLIFPDSRWQLNRITMAESLPYTP